MPKTKTPTELDSKDYHIVVLALLENIAINLIEGFSFANELANKKIILITLDKNSYINASEYCFLSLKYVKTDEISLEQQNILDSMKDDYAIAIW